MTYNLYIEDKINPAAVFVFIMFFVMAAMSFICAGYFFEKKYMKDKNKKQLLLVVFFVFSGLKFISENMNMWFSEFSYIGILGYYVYIVIAVASLYQFFYEIILEDKPKIHTIQISLNIFFALLFFLFLLTGYEKNVGNCILFEGNLTDIGHVLLNGESVAYIYLYFHLTNLIIVLVFYGYIVFHYFEGVEKTKGEYLFFALLFYNLNDIVFDLVLIEVYPLYVLAQGAVMLLMFVSFFKKKQVVIV